MRSAWVDRPGVVLSRRQEEDRLEPTLRLAGPAAVRVVFTRAAFFDNWFSHWHEAFRAAVVSMPGPGTAGAVDPRAFVAYQLVQHGLRTLGPAWAPEQLAHKETRGCMFDFCADRADVELKLQKAELCPSCETRARRRRHPDGPAAPPARGDPHPGGPGGSRSLSDGVSPHAF